MLFSQLRGQRVMSTADARQIGSVAQLLVNPRELRVAAAELEGTDGKTGSILPWQRVHSVGPAALMVASADVLETGSGNVARGLLAGAHRLVGQLLLNERGDALGQIADVEFDQQSGAVERLLVAGHALPIERIIAAGPDAVIVPVA